MIFVFMQRVFHIPHDEWVIITSAMIYAGFNTGMVLKRAYLRFVGTLVGVAAVSIVWYFMHLDYRLAVIFLVVIASLITFAARLPYNKYVIIVTLFSDTLIQILNPLNFHPEFYLFDRILCTCLVFGVCVVLEYIWFGRSNLTRLNYINLCNSLKTDIQDFYQLIQHPYSGARVGRSKVFKMIKKINFKIDQLTSLIEDIQHEGSLGYRLNAAEKQFGYEVVQIFRKIVSIHYLQSADEQHHMLPQLCLDTEKTISRFIHI